MLDYSQIMQQEANAAFQALQQDFTDRVEAGLLTAWETAFWFRVLKVLEYAVLK